MAKQKKKKWISNRVLTIAGLFTAGSIVGASVDFDNLLELNYTVPSLPQSDAEEKSPSFDEENETEMNTIQQVQQVPDVQPESTINEPAASEKAIAVPEKEMPAEQPPIQEYTPAEPPILSEFPFPKEEIPEEETEPMPESDPTVIPSEDWRTDDWMEAIFVPSVPPEQPEPESAPILSNDWMETKEESMQTDPLSSNESSMTSELAGMLEGIAVFWTSSGDKIHLNPSCRSFNESTIQYAGTLEEAQTLCPGGWCKLCADQWTGKDNSEFYIEGNIYSTKEILLDSYTYHDYCSGIPAN